MKILNGNMKKLNIPKYKKGNAILDSATIIIVLVAFFMISIIGYDVYKDINTDLTSDGMLNIQNQKIVDDLDNYYPPIFDSMLVFLMIMFTIGAIVSAFLIDTHPAFFVITILLLMVIYVVAITIGGSVVDIALEFGSTTDFPISFWIFNNLLTVAIINGSLITLALYSKLRYFS